MTAEEAAKELERLAQARKASLPALEERKRARLAGELNPPVKIKRPLRLGIT